MEDIAENPLNLIFLKNADGETSEEIENLKNIPEFFNYIKNNEISIKKKINVIEQLKKKFNVNRYLIEYFSIFEGRSIYLFIFDIFLSPNASNELKQSLINFISELRCNIETGKEVYQYLFQKLSELYRGEIPRTPEIMHDYLVLLNSILGSTEKSQKPRNYFSCIGNGQFMFDLNKQLSIGNAFSVLLNFKIGVSDVKENDANKESRISNLVWINISNGINITVDLKYPNLLVIKDLNDLQKELPINDFIFLFLTFIPEPQNHSIKIYLSYTDVNGKLGNLELQIFRPNPLKSTDSITSLEFFKNFYGEVSSIALFSQKEIGNCGILNKEFIEEIYKFKVGIWKKKNVELFLKILQKYISVECKDTIDKKDIKSSIKKNMKSEPSKTYLFDDLISVFTPMNCYNTVELEDYFGRTQLIFNGDIKNHRYFCYQKKIDLVCNLSNFLPIAEMLFVHQQLLTEDNFLIFLEIINNLIKYRKENMKTMKKNKFFKILCLFFEKYPDYIFTEKILNIFFEIGKNIFASVEKNFESLVANYFNHILLNEKILSKFDENLQVIFWKNMYKFCESDKSQIEILININRLCLILRFYDKNKYIEMCCEEHLNVFKDEFIGCKKVMNPPMNVKLSQLNDIMDLIILEQDPKNAVGLFKLLTLDLSPCLKKFILNIFINALTKANENETEKSKEWSENLIKELFKANIQVIITNTFTHSLPEIRLVIIKFIYIIYQKLKRKNEIKNFKKIENMIKTCLLPQDMFYEKITYVNNIDNSYYKPRKTTKDLSQIPQKIDNKRTASEINYCYNDLNSINNIGEDIEEEYIDNEKKKEEKMEVINKEVLVLKEEVYNEYLDATSCIFLDWTCDKEINIKAEEEDDIDINIVIRNINGLEMLSAMNSEITNPEYTKKFLNIINYIILSKGNAYLILSNNNIMIYLLDLSWNYYKLLTIKKESAKEYLDEDNTLSEIYELTKSSITDIFKNSLIFIEEEKYDNNLERIEIFFIWGIRILSDDENLQTKELLFEFLSDILFTLLNKYNEFYNKKLDNMFSTTNINKNFPILNYLIIITKLFYFCYLFKLDSVIATGGLLSATSYSQKIDLPIIYLSSMRIGSQNGKKISEYWMDYKLFNEIYSRVRYLWKMEKLFKGHDDIKKLKKEKKYEYILNNIILVKEKKNIYQTELEFLFYEEIKGQEKIISLMKIIIINLMSILSIANNSKNEEDMIYWLKEFKSFLKFIIITSSNLTKINQVEAYTNLQQKCLIIISLGLCFMKNMIDSAIICKEKLEKYFINIMNFCISIVYYQHNYNENHKLGKKVFSFAAKAARNDLSNCAVVSLFTEYVKDNSGNIILSQQNKNIYLNQKEKILNLIYKKEWTEGFFQNQILKSLINEAYFGLSLYEKKVLIRHYIANEISKEADTSYRKTILELLPNYEQELLKYSNNSFEKNIKIKNIYKKFKIQCFSWRGFWSDQKMFFREGGPNFKLKLVNHYTKNFMKPILVPILDMQYYLPTFSKFTPEKLFKDKDSNKNENNFGLNMDIDKILKSNDLNQSLIKNLKKNFESESCPNIQENYLRKLYTKSNESLSEKLLLIANKLDFGKEEEYIFIKRKSTKNIQLRKNCYLCCIVKTSHHIKGVCFVDDMKLNFKVFLNQKAGNAMSGVKMGFTVKDDDYDQERKTCFGSYFVCHPKDKDLYKITINYNDIKWIFRRRYYYKNTGLEIFTVSNKTFYLNFKYEEDREVVLNELIKKLDLVQIIDDIKDNKDIFGNVLGYENSSVIIKKKKKKKEKKSDKKIKLSKKIKDWKNWKITNFEFLMWLNIYSNRSYNDISQYPVFPWTLKRYKDPLQVEQKIKKELPVLKDDLIQNNNTIYMSVNTGVDFNINDETIIDYLYRDLSSPMGMLEINEESIKRKEQFKETFDTLKVENEENNEMEIKPYIYGSNYSNPTYVCNYLTRLFPFTHISIELQGYDFDKPERMFLSVINSFNNSTTQKTDVRELIPEFFYLPEMFININNLNLGVLENGEEVNDVKTPCNNNPYDFIMIMRAVLENDKLSENINSWIDLIFGSKAKGKEAENAFNLFTYSSYQENIDLKKSEGKENLLRLVEFGLIPTQIMSKDCTKREKKSDVLKEKEITDQNGNLQVERAEKNKIHVLGGVEGEKVNRNENLILAVRVSSDDKVNILLNSNTILEKKITVNLDKKTCVEESINTNKFRKIGNRIFNYQCPREYNDKTCIIFDEGNSVILGGYYDGKVIILTKNKKYKEIIPFNEDVPICALALNEEENYLFIGNMKGNIIVYNNINLELNGWKPIYKINDQMTEISDIYCSSELNLWSSASLDGYINIYSFPLSKLFRSIKVPSCRYVFLSASPLPAIIAIGNEKSENSIFIYSINGKFLNRQKEQNNILSPIMVKDLNSNDYLAYICNNNIIIRSIPNLIIQVLIEDMKGIYTIFTNINRTILYATNRYGSEIYVIKDHGKKAISHN